MAEYVLLDMSGRERSKLVSILDYEWISIRHTKDARTADTSCSPASTCLLIPRNFGIAGSIGVLALDAVIGGMIGVIVLAIKIIAIIREVINIIMELAGKRISC